MGCDLAVVAAEIAVELAEQVQRDGYQAAGVVSFAGQLFYLVELFDEQAGLKDAEGPFELVGEEGEAIVVLIREGELDIGQVFGQRLEQGGHRIADIIFITYFFEE